MLKAVDGPIGRRSQPPDERADVMQIRDVYQSTTRHFLAPVQILLDDPSVSEVLINGPDSIYFERGGRLHPANCSFPSESALLAAAQNVAEFVNRSLDRDHHSMDGRLPDGSRVHVILPPASRVGVCISIRKFQKSSFDLGRLIEWGSVTEEAAEFLRVIVALHKNIVISGGTGTGKTSMLNALSSAISPDERIVVIEDSSELQLQQPHTVYLEAQPPRPDGKGQVTIRDLFVDSLRMRPDRIVVGEVRRGEALDLIQSMISGHAGSMTTVHANTPRDSAVRLETLCLMSDVSLPVYVARTQVASALQIVIQIARLSDGSRRVQKISECLGLDDSNNYVFQDIYQFVASGRDAEGRIVGSLEATGKRPSFSEEPYRVGMGSQILRTKAVFGEPSLEL
jgi:pilus assembly protein CpaF